ncbi:TIGR03619 family F420-dependent LLM class oxidoreductase [Microtetraspora sp. AC03309]|uniref:TIGR03619 family F420-dependent LLM class oxidoreductase n=1 Tax=Microtetraspora sp. AC03309 TaxID=2779376 RepID=UPI001E28EEA8|nr:TIGR03619 family F420-dependent LLM class oxidoreductase [Microtetraspora sp. AC03309]MCC5575626.1 TIGR03619 family F420-dependent LLM class oxidoreductase [Microtetraspora sp. AC03309]
MKVGISSPILALSGNRPAWEEHAGVPELLQVAKTADRLGFDFMTCPDHVAVPQGVPQRERFYDPLATFSFLAGHTERLRFLPYVLVLPFYHPLELAKRFGTLDYLSGGRLILGLGVGSLRAEFDLLGKPFEDRGARADDALRALRACLSTRIASYDGPYFSFKEVVIDPHAVQDKVPLWVGGHSMRALRRATSLADGWAPAPQAFHGPSPEKLRQMLDSVELPPDFDVVFTPSRRVDALNAPDRVAELLETAAGAGGTRINLTVKHESLAHYLEQLEAFAELAFSA